MQSARTRLHAFIFEILAAILNSIATENFTMPPHCDTMDGPVVVAARAALEKGNVNLVLPWIKKESEAELEDAFKKTLRMRGLGNGSAEFADRWFYETAVRLHREGEGAAYSGLKPAGLGTGPVIPLAERALSTGDASEVADFLSSLVTQEIKKRFDSAISKKEYDIDNVDAAREYVQAMLQFLLFSHHLYKYIVTSEGKKVRAS